MLSRVYSEREKEFINESIWHSRREGERKSELERSRANLMRIVCGCRI